MLILFTIATFCATLCGGLFALHFKDRLHLILGFSAGAVIGVAFFDLLPEAIWLGALRYGISAVLSVVALGFISYMIFDRLLFFHGHGQSETSKGQALTGQRGAVGAGSLSLHSFFDGVGIGLAFQVSSAVGAIVAIAVLTHDFSDGINTVNIILRNQGQSRRAFQWLVADALAPVAGVFSTLFFSLSESALGIVLAVFSGFFLYIGASDLLPESHHGHPTIWTTAMTVLGVAVLFIAIKLAHI